MLWPLRILAVFSVIAGFIGVDRLYARQFGNAEEHLAFAQQIVFPFTHAPLAACIGLLAALVGFVIAFVLYANANSDPLPEKLGPISQAMRNRFYFDELYEAVFIPIHELFSRVADFIERWILEGFCINFARGGTDLLGRSLRWFQTGNLQTYALLFALGVGVILFLVLK